MSAPTNWGQRAPLESDIPETYPGKAAIEAHCRALLHELGPAWRMTIAMRGGSKGKWAMGLAHILPDGRDFHRTWHVVPYVDKIEQRIRAAADAIRREAATRFGMVPIRVPEPAIAEDLHAWVRANGGDVEADGWVWLPERSSWQPFLERAANAGVCYVADVRFA